MQASITQRVRDLPWEQIRRKLDEVGFAKISTLLSPDECTELINTYTNDDLFRSVINMARYRFGEGEYKYFNHPLPSIVSALRAAFYPQLSQVANEWGSHLGHDRSMPEDLEAFLSECHRNGQTKPTPLILRYEKGGYNCLHQDLYGNVYFPFQVLFLLSGEHEFTGGEFVLTEQRPRAQSRAHVVRLSQGEGLIFPTQFRPVAGKRGFYRANMRHGVSTISSGIRYTAGIIFHDAE